MDILKFEDRGELDILLLLTLDLSRGSVFFPTPILNWCLSRASPRFE